MSGPASLKPAVRAAIRSAGGIEAVAAALGYSKSHVGRWNCLNNPDLPDPEQRTALDELAMANGAAPEILKAMARRLDHVAVPMPEAFGDASHAAMAMCEVVAHVGSLSQQVVTACADSRIDPREAGAIAELIEQTAAALMHLRARVGEEQASSSAAVGHEETAARPVPVRAA